jgi:hypothetical protein
MGSIVKWAAHSLDQLDKHVAAKAPREDGDVKAKLYEDGACDLRVVCV